MTTYTGAYPIDVETQIGQLRLAVDDTTITEDNGDGTAEYLYWGDEQLQVFLTMANDNFVLAKGYAYQALAAIITIQAKDFTSDDLRVEAWRRADILRRLANDIINGGVASAAALDILVLAGGEDELEYYPEGQPIPWWIPTWERQGRPWVI
jgi:hypothetical protein